MHRRRTSSVSACFHSLVLDTNVNLTSPGIYYIPSNSHLHFTLASSLTPYDVQLFCDYHSTNYKRGVYHQLTWSSKNDDRFAQLLCTRPGPIHYYFTAKDKKGEGYLIVEPSLAISPSSDSDEIMCLTVLSKSLGKMDDWESRLAIAYHSNYNMIHFTPIQQLYKVSNSSYSITHHHELNLLFGKDKTHDDIKKIVDKMANEWNILSITDLVYNHAANDCAILEKHPEASYNLINSPHLKPAFLLDAILMHFTRDVNEGKIEKIPAKIEKEHLPVIQDYLLNEILPQYALHEFYMIDVKKTIDEFSQLIQNEIPSTSIHNYDEEYAFRIDYGSYTRYGAKINLKKAREIFYRADRTPMKACQVLNDRLMYLNHLKYSQVQADLNRAIENCTKGCEYHFFDPYGPHFTTISPKTPFTGNYFAYPHEKIFETSPIEVEQAYNNNDRKFLERVMAHNGWVMNDNPLRNFAEDTQGPNVYFRRELNQWSDIVKLNFGSCEEDSPHLWAYMKEYTRLIATTFHGARLDNCHSTPLFVAQYLMDYARELNPNFYILGELFTSSETLDNTFINKLGINALVRESLNARLPCDLGHMICGHGRLTIGALFRLQTVLLPRRAQAFFYDQTHDNPCPIERRSLADVLPRSAYVAMSCTPTGSNRGYDELVPHHIDVVHERRTYEKWTDDKKKNLVYAKSIFNRLHARLSSDGYTRMIADQLSSNTLMIIRQHPITNSTIILIGYTDTIKLTNEEEKIEPLIIQGTIEDILFEMNLSWLDNEDKLDLFSRDIDHINGLREKDLHFYINEHVKKDQCRYVEITQENENSVTKVIFNRKTLLPGTVIAFQVNLLENTKYASNELRKELFENELSSFRILVSKCSFVDLNFLLYRCKNEENNEIYIIPEHGSLVYAGLQGIESVLIKMRSLTTEQMIKHPLCIHLKQGNWLMLYLAQRLINNKQTKSIGQWYEKYFQYIEKLPKYLIPVYFDILIHRTYNICVERAIDLMSTTFVQQGSSFIKALAMTSVQMMGIVSNARLPNFEDNNKENEWPSMAAGLPNFSEGIWRNWGRDTFIALRGLLLLTGRFDDARHLIITYGSCLRHGLIPNLLAGPRYNARDAIWFYLYSISEYTQLAPNGHSILSETIQGKPLHSIVKTAINTHLNGLSFREYNAGYQLDRVMSDEGFNNRIGVDSKTGFVFGGNRWNSGTWMDKMGSSEHAGNKGYPGSPRDGSAIELIGLSRATINWLIQMIEKGFYPYAEQKQILQDWLNKIDENFEKEFWIDEHSNQSHYINRRNIYKDTVNSSLQYTDYQFRPNFLIAAVVAPEMFNKDHIWSALSQVESLLLGPLGIRTLDPSDEQYNGDYDNKNESSDFKLAHGYNYHNGPEWVWITGYYLRAKLLWSPVEQRKETLEHVQEVLARHRETLFTSEWKSLPELTSTNGSLCRDSCPAQAWSSATILEAVYDIQQYN
ncbi:unnamed protein product [Adineta steineri]|uniref:4-alpha-glucanotransferase n=1 Tax=Adineta steineri TaxID=433720 RepID=A0A815JTN0_9BILA|nr:unnamed protein product [Adineta steineri]CAF1380973.1 unnamed protein product [Adineta steineri]